MLDCLGGFFARKLANHCSGFRSLTVHSQTSRTPMTLTQKGKIEMLKVIRNKGSC